MMRLRLWQRFCAWLSRWVGLSAEDSAVLQRFLREASGDYDACFFVMQSPSRLDYALLRCVLRRLGLRCEVQLFAPRRVSGITKAAGGVFCLRNWRGNEILWTDAVHYRRRLWDALDDLVQGQKRRVVFIPFSIIAGLGPAPLFQPFRLHLDFSVLPLNDVLRVASYLLYRRSLRCVFGPVVTNDAELSGSRLCRGLVVRLARHQRMARGVRPLPARIQRELVLSGSEITAEIKAQSKITGMSRFIIERAAHGEMKKMAAGMRAWAVRLAYIILHPLIRRVFGELEVSNIEQVRRSFDAGPAVIVASHRTHFDYLILSYLFYFRQMPLPYIAAGDNLDFWPIGALLRSAGAFFIRRRVGDDRVYRVVLANYLRMLVKQGALIEFFIEGGRSRSGALCPPRMGILKYIVEGWAKGDRRDLAFIPAAVSYDRVPEETSIIREFAGMRKERESMFSLLKLWGVWRRHFGAVRVVFGEPVSIQEFCTALDEKLGRRADTRTIASALGNELAEEIKRRTPLTVSALGAVAVMSFGDMGISGQELEVRLSRLFWLHRFLHCGYAAYGEPDELSAAEIEQMQLAGALRREVNDYGIASAMKHVTGWLVTDGLLQEELRNDRHLLRVAESAALRLVYYRNSVFHHYLLPAVLAQSVHCSQSPFSASVGVLYEILAGFFVLPVPLRWQEIFSEFVHRVDAGRLGGPEAWEPLRHLLLPFVKSVYVTADAVLKYAAAGILEEDLREQRRQLSDELWPDCALGRVEICADFMFKYSLRFIQERGIVQMLPGAAAQGNGEENGEERTVVIQSVRKLEKLVRELNEQLL